HIDVLFTKIDSTVVRSFRDNLKAKFFAHLGHDLPSFFAQSLKGIRRSAWLDRASAKEFRATALDNLGDRKSLFAALDRTWPGDDGQLLITNGCVADVHNCFLRSQVARNQFVRFTDSNRFRH